LIAADSTLFVCPKCGKPTLASHRKTYEKTVIFFCTNCHMTETYTPSKDAYLDPELAWREFAAKHRQTIA
jgi:ribosomal protein S27AE